MIRPFLARVKFNAVYLHAHTHVFDGVVFFGSLLKTIFQKRKKNVFHCLNRQRCTHDHQTPLLSVLMTAMMAEVYDACTCYLFITCTVCTTMQQAALSLDVTCLFMLVRECGVFEHACTLVQAPYKCTSNIVFHLFCTPTPVQARTNKYEYACTHLYTVQTCSACTSMFFFSVQTYSGMYNCVQAPS